MRSVIGGCCYISGVRLQDFLGTKCTSAAVNKDLQLEKCSLQEPVSFCSCKDTRRFCSDKINFAAVRKRRRKKGLSLSLQSDVGHLKLPACSWQLHIIMRHCKSESRFCLWNLIWPPSNRYFLFFFFLSFFLSFFVFCFVNWFIFKICFWRFDLEN